MFITYPQPDGQVAVVFPSGDVKDSIKDVPAGVEYKIIESLDIDDEFFNAYEFDKDSGTKINITKAKSIQLDKFREVRAPLLEKLDVAFMRAVEAGDAVAQQQIAAKKQALRDVTSVELPDDLTGIKAVWPEVLQ
jgi:hypothetical protein